VLLRSALTAQEANLVALAATAVANTAANRRLTFGLRGSSGLLRQHAAGFLVFALSLALTAGSLAALEAVASRPPRPLELAVLVVSSAVATVTRYVLLLGWVFRRARVSEALARATMH
jgi:putative flippase GtrA